MPASMTRQRQSVPNAADATHMLTSLLLVYPSIGSAQLIKGQSVLVLTFYSRRLLSDAKFRHLAAEIRQAFSIWQLVYAEPSPLRRVYRSVWRSLANEDGEATPSPAMSKSERSAQSEYEAQRASCVGNRSARVSHAEGKTELESCVESESTQFSDAEDEAEGPNFTACDLDRTVLESLRPRNFHEYWSGLTEALECVSVDMCLPLINPMVIDMLVALISDSWGSCLVTDANVGIDEERLLGEAGNFNTCLEALKQELIYNTPEKDSADLLAYRDEVRILVNIGPVESAAPIRGDVAIGGDAVASEGNATPPNQDAVASEMGSGNT